MIFAQEQCSFVNMSVLYHIATIIDNYYELRYTNSLHQSSIDYTLVSDSYMIVYTYQNITFDSNKILDFCAKVTIINTVIN